MESNRRNYYRILHVQPEAPEAVIRASYRTIMQRLRAHPDLGGDHAAAALLNEAYAVLTDPGRRAAYDAALKPRRHPGAGGAAARHETGSAATPRGPTPGPSPTPTPTPAPSACAFCGAPDRRAPRADRLCTGCGSPLQPAGHTAVEAPGRALPRFERQQPAVIWTHWPQPQGVAAELRDLSPLGLRLVTAAPLTVGQAIKVDSALFRAVVRVTSVRREPAGGCCTAGGAFVTVLFSEPRGGFVSLRA